MATFWIVMNQREAWMCTIMFIIAGFYWYHVCLRIYNRFKWHETGTAWEDTETISSKQKQQQQAATATALKQPLMNVTKNDDGIVETVSAATTASSVSSASSASTAAVVPAADSSSTETAERHENALQLSLLLKKFVELSRVDGGRYFLCDHQDMICVSNWLHTIPLTVAER